MATLPIFGAGNYKNILNAISQGTISYPAWMFCRDKQMLGFVERDGSFVLMKGDNKEQVVYVDKLPEISEGDTSVLYIVGTICYKFDGSKFVALGKDHTAELEELTEKVTSLETKVKELEATDTTLAELIAALKEQVEAIEIPEECDCGEKYEITDAPIGTLVDYFDKEIRIMCPSNAVFTKQAVGTGGDANSYYVTFKTYVPDDNVVGYIEHLGEQVDNEILTTFSTDENGRRYQPTWLAVAKYDENTDAWTYYGEKSTKNKYIGWDYQIDWYDDNGVIISSDCVRINLSNEECHFCVEPYYLAGIKAQINDVTEQLVEFEDRIVEVEKATLTFVELE